MLAPQTRAQVWVSLRQEAKELDFCRGFPGIREAFDHICSLQLHLVGCKVVCHRSRLLPTTRLKVGFDLSFLFNLEFVPVHQMLITTNILKNV